MNRKHSQNNVLLTSIIFVFILSIISKAFAFFRDVFFTSTFGICTQTDAFYSVNSLIEALIVFSGLQALFGFTTSSFMKLRVENSDQKEFSRYYTSYIVITCVFSFALTLIVVFFSHSIVCLILRGFSSEVQIFTAKVLQIAAPLILLSTVIRVLSSLLGVEKMFVWQNLYLLFVNCGSMAIVLLFPHERTVFYLVLQILVFYSIFCTLYLFVLHRKGYSFSFVSINTVVQHLKSIAPFIVPLTLVTSFESIASIIERTIASFYQQGIITALTLSQNLTYFTVSALFTAIIRVIFPEFSHLYYSNKFSQLSLLFNKAFSLTFFIFFPIAMFIIFFSRDIILGLYFRKNFTLENVQIVSSLLSLYGLALLGNVYYQLPSFLLQSIQKNKIVGVLGCISYSVYIIAVLGMSKLYGYKGIPIGAILGFSTYALLLFIVTYRSLNITLSFMSCKIAGIVIISSFVSVLIFKMIPINLSLSVSPVFLYPATLCVRSTYFVLVWLGVFVIIKVCKIPFSLSLKTE